MAYGTKYQLEWTTPTADCRVEIQQSGYNSSVVHLDPAAEPFQLTWAEQNKKDLTLPLQVSTAVVRFFGDDDGELVQEIFDGGDTEWRLLFKRNRGSGFQIEWQGFLATDLWRDNPHQPSDVVELEAIDGLALLKDRDLNLTQTQDLYTICRNVLRGLHSLNVAATMEWYPYREGNQLNADELPLAKLLVDEQAFDELEPVEGENSFESAGKRSQHRALEAILERFGMELFQSRGEWRLRQRHRIQSDGTINVWPDKDAVDNNDRTTRDLNRTLGSLAPRERPRSLVQRLRETQSVHTYDQLGDLIKNGIFEDEGLSGWKTFDADVEVQTYADSKVNKTGTQENNQLLRVPFTDPVANDQPYDLDVRQDVPAILHDAGPRSALRFQFDLAALNSPETRIALSGPSGSRYYVQTRSADVSEEAKPAEDGRLVLSNTLDGNDGTLLIPKGTRLYFHKPDGSRPQDYSKEITLSEPAYAGDEVLKGSISQTIESGAKVYYWVWSDQEQDYLGLVEYPNQLSTRDEIIPQRLQLPVHTPQGTNLAGGDLSIGWVISGPQAGDGDLNVDNVSAQLTIENEPVDQTSYTAFDDQSGREIQITQLLGDGPTAEHPRALQFSGVEVTRDWKIGPYVYQEYPSEKLLEQVTAEAAMRQQRDTLQRRTHEVHLRNEEVWPQDVFTIDGEQYTVSYLQRTFSTGAEKAEVELTRLKDAGTSGLRRAYQMESTGADGGGGGGGISSGASGGGGATGWDLIEGKPGSLLAANGDSDGFPATQALESADISAALSHSPGLSEGIQTSIREEGVASDEALPTEQAVREEIATVGEDTTLIAQELVQTQAEIEALEAVTVRRGREVLISGTSNQVGVSGRDGDLSSNIVLSLFTPQNIHTEANFEVRSLNVDSAATPSAGQVALGAQADETFESLRADRNVSVNGTTNQVAVTGRSGTLTQDVNVTLETPQNIHTEADFQVEKLGVGTSVSPNSGGGHFTGFVGHPDYIAETDHWRIDAAGLGDFRTLLADELRVDEFIAEVNEALAGEDLLTKSFAKLDAPFTVPSSTGSTGPLRVQNLPGLGNSRVFSSGDTVRLRYVDRSGGGLTVADVWLKVTGYTDNGDGTQTWTAELLDSTAASGSDLGEGTLALDYGDPSTGGYLIERSVLDKGGSIAPYDRILKWEDTTGNGVPDDYTVLNLRGELGSLSKAYGNGPGTYTEQGRFTEDVIVGDLNAATSSTSGDYLEFDGSLQIVVTDSEGDERNIIQMADDLKLLARRVTQQEEAQAGIELNVSENAVTLTASVQFSETTSSETNRAALELFAGPDGSSATIVGESIQLDGDTIVSGDFTVQEPNIGPEYTSQGEEAQTIRKSSSPNDSDVDGRGLQKGDVWINISAGDKPYTYTGSSWNPAYTLISGGDITTGTIQGPSGEFSIGLDSGDFILSQGVIKDSVTIGGISAQQIRQGGLTFQAGMENEGSDWDDSTDFPFTSITSPVWSGSYAARMSSQLDTGSAGSGGQPGTHTKIPEEIALEFAGRTVEVTVWAKANTASEFAVSYSTADAGNSGWQRFSPTSGWESYRFTYDVPNPGSGGSDFLGIIGDADGNQNSTYIDRVTVRPQTQRMASFEIGANRIEHFNESGVLDVAIGSRIGTVDANQTAIFGVSGGAAVPAMKVRGSSSGDYVLARGASSGALFEVLQDGDSVFKVEDSGGDDPSVFIDELSLLDLLIEGTLTMGTGGKITDDASPINYSIDSDGVDFRATDSTRASATEVAWLEPDLTGTVRGEIYAHNQKMNITSYRFGSPNSVQTTLTAYDRPKTQTGKEYARIELNAEQYGNNEVNLVINDSNGGEFNIRNADVGGVVFDFDPFDWYMGIKKVYNFDSVPGASPPSPSNGLRLYAKDELTGNDVPYLWFINENGTQYRIDATPIT
jgi:hypothetical protein